MKRITFLIFALIAILLPLAVVRPSAAQSIKTVPLYRLFAHRTGIHFYTIDINRKLEAIGAGWSDEGIAAYVVDQQAPSTVPVYVLTNHAIFYITGSSDNTTFGNMFAFTAKLDMRDKLLATKVPNYDSTWKYDRSGVGFYISAQQLPGTVPLYRLQHPAANPQHVVFNDYDCLLTTSEAEKNDHLANHGYQIFGIEGYVWPQSATLSMQPAVPPKNTPKLGAGTQVPPTNPDTDLLKRGCTRPAVGSYNCSTVASYEMCEIYRQQGKVNACSTTANLKVQAAMEKLLFSVGCTRFLGRPDEFLCKTQKSYDLCETYRQNGHAKKCLLTKQ